MQPGTYILTQFLCFSSVTVHHSYFAQWYIKITIMHNHLHNIIIYFFLNANIKPVQHKKGNKEQNRHTKEKRKRKNK